MTTNGTTVQLSTMTPADYSFRDVMSMGDIYYQSGLFKDIRSAAQAIVKIMKGRELGIPPASAMEIINVIEGKTALSGVAIAGIIKKSRKYRHDVVECTTRGATIEFFERLDGAWTSLGRSTFIEEDAKRAGLTGKKNWRDYPRNMYLWRALSNGGRMFCPDILAGVYTPDELSAEDASDASLPGMAGVVSESTVRNHTIDSYEVITTVEISDEASGSAGAQAVSSDQESASQSAPIGTAAESEQVDASTQDNAGNASQAAANGSGTIHAAKAADSADPRPEWLREAAQDIKAHLSQQELMELRMMWRDTQYPRIDIVERIRTLAKNYRVHVELSEED